MPVIQTVEDKLISIESEILTLRRDNNGLNGRVTKLEEQISDICDTLELLQKKMTRILIYLEL